jgi:hypothetical protein
MATTARRRASDWVFTHGAYLDAVAVISAPALSLQGSDELRAVVREVLRCTDEWAGVIPVAMAYDIHDPVFLRLLLTVAERANAEWPAPAGYGGWGAVLAELVRQADKAREGSAV